MVFRMNQLQRRCTHPFSSPSSSFSFQAVRFVTPPTSKIPTHGYETKIPCIQTDSFVGSTITCKTEACFSLIFLRIPILAISVWSLSVANTPTRLVSGSPWKGEISIVSKWAKERRYAGSYTANIQEKQWQVSNIIDCIKFEILKRFVHREKELYCHHFGS